jgi:hypothetical protein
MSGQTRAPWDRRLTDRWARQAREAANDPNRYARPSLRERMRSPHYSVGFAAVLSGLIASWADAPAGVWAPLLGVGYLTWIVDMAMTRRRQARYPQPAKDQAEHQP